MLRARSRSRSGGRRGSAPKAATPCRNGAAVARTYGEQPRRSQRQARISAAAAAARSGAPPGSWEAAAASPIQVVSEASSPPKPATAQPVANPIPTPTTTTTTRQSRHTPALRPTNNSAMGPDLSCVVPERLEVLEVDAMREKDAAYSLHLSKNTFQEEKGLVQLRVFSGDAVRCRTWVLVQRAAGLGDLQQDSPLVSSGSGTGRGRGAQPMPGHRGATRATRARGGRGGWCTRSRSAAAHEGAAYLAAVTVRINCYQKRQGRWAQILNMSARRERLGFGTLLIAGLEELLLPEAVDVVVLYPAENGRAPAFWSSLGFGAREVSHLPAEELVPHDQGGPLLPEFDTGTQVVLPRWEKRLRGPTGVGDKPFGSPSAAVNPSNPQDAAATVPVAPAQGLSGTSQATCGMLRGSPGTKQRGRGRRASGPAAVSAHRTLPCSASRIRGDLLLAAYEAMKAQKARLKAFLAQSRQQQHSGEWAPKVAD